ncbi:MAG: hypothetical protein ACI4P4_06940 [Faecousia sp.]
MAENAKKRAKRLLTHFSMAVLTIAVLILIIFAIWYSQETSTL